VARGMPADELRGRSISARLCLDRDVFGVRMIYQRGGCELCPPGANELVLVTSVAAVLVVATVVIVLDDEARDRLPVGGELHLHFVAALDVVQRGAAPADLDGGVGIDRIAPGRG